MRCFRSSRAKFWKVDPSIENPDPARILTYHIEDDTGVGPVNSAGRLGKITCPSARPLRVEKVFEEDDHSGMVSGCFFVVFGDDTLAWWV